MFQTVPYRTKTNTSAPNHVLCSTLRHNYSQTWFKSSHDLRSQCTQDNLSLCIKSRAYASESRSFLQSLSPIQGQRKNVARIFLRGIETQVICSKNACDPGTSVDIRGRRHMQRRRLTRCVDFVCTRGVILEVIEGKAGITT